MAPYAFPLSMSNVPLSECTSLFIHLLAEGHLPSLAIMNKAAMNSHMQVFVWTYVFNSFG